jgi:hypothetical protein
MNDTQSKIGKLLEPGEQRDAIHVAVLPVVAGQQLEPGDHVHVKVGSGAFAFKGGDTVGIVDPYLTKEVEIGERCFVFLYPNTVTDMRHHWAHPALETLPAVDKAISVKWMNEFAATLWDYDEAANYDEEMENRKTFTADEVMEMAKNFLETEECYTFGTSSHEEVPPEFWHHFQVITGVKVQAPAQQSFFRCSC